MTHLAKSDCLVEEVRLRADDGFVHFVDIVLTLDDKVGELSCLLEAAIG
jgi:hypothetical protein